jgi:hypothetical protein
MKKLSLLLILFIPVLAFSQDKKFSYTYIDLIATNTNGIGYIGDISLGLPASLYVKGSIRDEEVKSGNTVYQKSKKIVALGYHSSIADIFKNVSKSGFSFNFARIMDVYAELGVNQWELENPTKITKTGSDIYAQAAKALITEGKANAVDFPEFATETGFKPPQTEFIDKIVYDGSEPNAYLEKFAIGLKKDSKI